MAHYQRNIRFLFFIIAPIIGFILGWSVSQKTFSSAAAEGSTPKEKAAQVLEPEIGEVRKEPGLKISPFGKSGVSSKNVDLDIFWETWNTLEKNYLTEADFDTKAQIYGSTKGLVQSLGDPYTTFLTPEEIEEFEESMSGEFQGIGAYIEFKDENLVIVAPVNGSPADKAGLKSGDFIYKVNDELVHGLSIDEAVAKIRGPKGSPVTLTIIREGERKPLEITIVRDEIVIKSVEWEMKEKVAVVSLHQFGTNASEEFQTAVEAIVLKNPEAMIVDLRNNGGGLLDASVDIMSEFLDRKVVVKTKGRNFGSSGDLVSRRGGSLLNIPLLVLINGGSASASEIFAGAIQDHNRGYVLGETSFGKGSVQNLIPLSDGSSLKVTVSEWLTPKERSIHEAGIEPDEIVEISDEDYENEVDTVLNRAIEIISSGQLPELMSAQAEAQEPQSEGDITKQNDKNTQE